MFPDRPADECARAPSGVPCCAGSRWPFGPPPSRIFSSSLRTCETRSARKRMLASKRAEVGSTRDCSTAEVEGVPGSLRSFIREESETDYGITAGAHAQTSVRSAAVYKYRGVILSGLQPRRIWRRSEIHATRSFPSSAPGGNRLPPAESCRNQNTHQVSDAIPDRARPA